MKTWDKENLYKRELEEVKLESVINFLCELKMGKKQKLCN